MVQKNQLFLGANNRKSVLDLIEPETEFSELILFLHGYKGYKDWGAWNLAGEMFAQHGIAFCSFNFSHNGGSPENPIDFPDLEAFANNRYSYELDDVKAVIRWLTENGYGDKNIHLIGHSRGGGIAVLSALENDVKSLITWASVADFEERFPKGDAFETWKKEGIRYVENGRTKQQMPHYFSFYEDFVQNKARLDILATAKKLRTKNIPCLHIHGDKDEAVSPNDAERLAQATGGKKIIIPQTNHTFDSKHPWTKNQLPDTLEKVCTYTIDFILQK